MLLNKKIKIKTGAQNFKYYKELGYIFDSMKEEIEIDIKHLTKGSRVIVDVSCDYCGKILHIPYKRYIKYTSVCDKYACSDKDCSNKKIKDVCLIKYGVENPFQAEFVKEKSKETFKEKYGVEHQMHIQEIKDKIKKTCLERYGVEYPIENNNIKNKYKQTCTTNYGYSHDNKNPKQKEKRKITRIKKGLQLPDNMIEPYLLYRRQVDNISDKLKMILLKSWDGYDYYDGEYIRDNFNLKCTDKRYPTLDHKKSVYYGFINNISIEKIASIENLCFTKNILNSKKGILNEDEYKKIQT